jgi:hypothetical protein
VFDWYITMRVGRSYRPHADISNHIRSQLHDPGVTMRSRYANHIVLTYVGLGPLGPHQGVPPGLYRANTADSPVVLVYLVVEKDGRWPELEAPGIIDNRL